MFIFRFFIFSLLTGYCITSAYGAHYKLSDSLKKYDYIILFDKIENSKDNKELNKLYLEEFLNRAKSERNLEEIINGYKNYIHYSDDKPSVIYADSMIAVSLKSNDTSLIGSAYLTKGIVLYWLKEHKQALDYYLIANEYISKTNDDYLKYKTKYNLAHVKNYLGMYDEAIVLFESCVDYFKANNSRGYLNTLHSLALCHNKIGNYGYSSDLNALGVEEGKRLSDSSMEHYFIHLEGINHYYRGNYALAIEKINHSLSGIRANNDFANEIVGKFYIGKSLLGLRQPEKALVYFKKVEQVFDEKNYIRPDLRENFELLIKHYEAKGNLNLKLHYIQKLIKADSILNTNYKYLSEKIHKEYDTKELLRKKAEIREQLELQKKKDKLMIGGIIFLLVLLLVVIYRYIRNKKLYKQRFEELMNHKHEETLLVSEKRHADKTVLDINPEVAEQLLKQLEKFEKQKKYLEKDLTIVKLAASFNSNTKYLSKIIYYYRGKKFVDYLNDLKIDYVVALLKSDKKFRNYTNKALAEEIGFSSTQRFTTAFIARTGISPTYFIEELKKESEL
jgi:AraC-like DNA-binding protein